MTDTTRPAADTAEVTSTGTSTGAVDFTSAAPRPGSLDVAWRHGTGSARRRRKDGGEPPIQVHHYDEHTVIMRQSKSLSYEAPFLYLLFGNERALLLDTGATEEPERFPLRATVDGLVDAWLREHPREDYALVVAHSHGHGDHVAADPQFADRPRTTVVPREAAAVQEFFGLDPEVPDRTGRLDLGGRVLEVLHSPGHHEAAVTLHDPWTGVLLTGDTVLPGRLFAFDAAAYLATMERLVAFAATRPVTHVLGCHIEMTGRPGRDYPIGADHQPRERALELTPAHLTAVRDAAAAAASAPGVHRHPDFVLYSQPAEPDLKRLLRRGRTHKALRRVTGR
ncbi:MBL fold metallo-hydrolase [Actinacidiphila rubida]|uniref:Glyoxylase, beta-lactamase superfamily II n=1 Tax=Actinacidiphila rubida TaxID=310780 RepID=A0A1H8MUX3_9ACTN|nr:MBL fold metallo-hydrolase [Actinacidiphila rubida]SEO21078.1 Glyoxylase, beta-lactamase superfamily II [Actinacidiphila rubida]